MSVSEVSVITKHSLTAALSRQRPGLMVTDATTNHWCWLCHIFLPMHKFLFGMHAGSSAGSWKIDAAHAEGHSSPTVQAMASRQHSGVTTSSHDVHDAAEV